MKKLISIAIIASLTLIGGYYLYQTKEMVLGYYTPPVGTTKAIEFGFTAYNDTIENDTHAEFIEAGGTLGRLQCTSWRTNQTDNHDGTYTYDWNAIAGCSDLDALVNNGDIRTYLRIDTQGSGAPTIDGMTNYYFNTLADPLPYVDFIKTLTNRYKTGTHYYTFNNEADYNFTKDATSKTWNATAQNYVASFIMTVKKIKEIDPQAKICYNMTHADMNPNPDFNPYKGMDAMLELGAGNYIDCIDLHFYGQQIKVDGVWIFRQFGENYPFDTYATRIKNKLAEYGRSDVDLWIGEWGIGTMSTSSPSFDDSVNWQKLEIVKQNVNFAAQGFTKIFNILLFDFKTDTCTGVYDWMCAGIMDGSEVKKPSFDVYKQMTSLLKGTEFVSTSTPTSLLQYRFASSTADIYVGYSNVDGTTTWAVTLDQNYTSGQVIDAIALTTTPIAPTSLQSGDIISEDVSTTTIKYLYLIK